MFVFLHFQTGHPLTYCRLNHNVPILSLWFSVESELREDFRLSRKAMQAVQHLLRREQDHGWGHELEVLIYIGSPMGFPTVWWLVFSTSQNQLYIEWCTGLRRCFGTIYIK